MINEKYVLGAMLQWEEKLLFALDRINESHFSHINSVLLFRQIKELFDKRVKISLTTVSATAEKLTDYAMDCVEHAPTKQPFESHLELLENAYINRELKILLQSSLYELEKEETNISDIQTSINQLALQAVRETEYSHGHSVMDFWIAVEERSKNKSKLIGMRTPWDRINMTINNLQKGRTYIIGGLKKTGKSRFAIHLTSGLLTDCHSGIWFSMEMQPPAIHACIFAARTEIDTNLLHSGNIFGRQQEALKEVNASYVNENLYISNKSSVSPAYISTIIKSRKHKGNVDFVIVDYVQRMRGRVTTKGNRVEELENIMADLSDIARNENVAMIILSQLSGEAEKKTGNPVYSYFKGSQAILECADCAIVLTDANRGTATDALRNYKEIDAMIIQRDGASDVEINFNAYLQYSKFVETVRAKTENKTEETRRF